MRMLSIQPGGSAVDLPLEAIVCHDVRNPAQRSEVLARKARHFARTKWRHSSNGVSSNCTWRCQTRAMWPKNKAAARLAATVIGPRLKAGDADYGQASLMSTDGIDHCGS